MQTYSSTDLLQTLYSTKNTTITKRLTTIANNALLTSITNIQSVITTACKDEILPLISEITVRFRYP